VTPTSTPRPTHGFTRRGQPVHGNTLDHLPEGTRYQRFNRLVAVGLTRGVFTMTAFWGFWALCLLVLPAVLPPVGFPRFMTSFHYELFMTWLLSTCFQLTLLPALGVGQNLQTEAADARAAKTFEDVGVLLDRLDTSTQGGITEVLDAVKTLAAK
jgi:hypothetical protein